MINTNLELVLGMYAPELLQTRALCKGIELASLIDPLWQRWGITIDGTTVSKIRANDISGRVIGRRILFQEMLKPGRLNQERFKVFSLNVLDQIQELSTQRTVWGMRRSQGLPEAISEFTQIPLDHYRHLIGALRTNAVLSAESHPELYDDFICSRDDYLHDLALRPESQRKVDPYPHDNMREWYREFGKFGPKSMGSFVAYEANFISRALCIQSPILPLTSYVLNLVGNVGCTYAQAAEIISEDSLPSCTDNALQLFMEYSSMDFPSQFIDRCQACPHEN